MLSLAFIWERALATRSAQQTLALLWVWTEQTLAQWNTRMDAYATQVELVADKNAITNSLRGDLDAQMDALHSRTQVGLSLLKTKCRNNPAQSRALFTLSSIGSSRALILEESLAFESAWEDMDPTWVPMPGETLAAYEAFREEVVAANVAYVAAKGIWRHQAENLNELAFELNDLCMGWYAAATQVFKEGTPEGDMIRGTIPTTTDFTPLPGQAQIQLEAAPEPLSYAILTSAEHATKFDIYQRILGETEWLKVGVDVLPGLYVKTGLVAGDYEVKAQPRNSRGAGPDSETLSISVS